MASAQTLVANVISVPGAQRLFLAVNPSLVLPVVSPGGEISVRHSEGFFFRPGPRPFALEARCLGTRSLWTCTWVCVRVPQSVGWRPPRGGSIELTAKRSNRDPDHSILTLPRNSLHGTACTDLSRHSTQVKFVPYHGCLPPSNRASRPERGRKSQGDLQTSLLILNPGP